MDLIENLAREIYHARSNSPRPMTDERWERIKRMFPGSVRVCREDAEQMLLEDEQDAAALDEILRENEEWFANLTEGMSLEDWREMTGETP